MKNELYQALTQHYYNLQSERKACGEQIYRFYGEIKVVDRLKAESEDKE